MTSSEKKVDLFLKTYIDDYPKLPLLLQSIQKYVTGYNQLLIITDESTNENTNENMSKLLAIIQNYIEPLRIQCFSVIIPNNSIHCVRGIGYLWQQCVKLSWTSYSSVDIVFFLDSDCAFCQPIDITSYYFYDNNIPKKKKWFYRSWEHANSAIIWKQTVDKIIYHENNTKTFQTYELMSCFDFAFYRNDTNQFHQFIQTKFQKSINELILNHEKEFDQFSEFNVYGNWAKLYSNNYEFLDVYKAPFHHYLLNSRLLQFQGFDYHTAQFHNISHKLLINDNNNFYDFQQFQKDKVFSDFMIYEFIPEIPCLNYLRQYLVHINFDIQINTISLPRSGLFAFDLIFRKLLGDKLMNKLYQEEKLEQNHHIFLRHIKKYMCGGYGTNCCTQFPCNKSIITKNHYFLDAQQIIDVNKTKVFLIYRNNLSKNVDAYCRFSKQSVDTNMIQYIHHFYKTWIIPYHRNIHPNVLLLEYHDVIRNPKETVRNILLHLFDNNSTLFTDETLEYLSNHIQLQTDISQEECDFALLNYITDGLIEKRKSKELH